MKHAKEKAEELKMQNDESMENNEIDAQNSNQKSANSMMDEPDEILEFGQDGYWDQ